MIEPKENPESFQNQDPDQTEPQRPDGWADFLNRALQQLGNDPDADADITPNFDPEALRKQLLARLAKKFPTTETPQKTSKRRPATARGDHF